MAVLVTCKNEEEPIKNEGARVLTTLYINFPDAQGQLTPKSVVGFGQNPNLSNNIFNEFEFSQIGPQTTNRKMPLSA